MKTKQLAFESAAGRIGRAIEQAQIDFRLSDADVLKLLAFEIAYRSGLLDSAETANDAVRVSSPHPTIATANAEEINESR
jgi:hypothetical protein